MDRKNLITKYSTGDVQPPKSRRGILSLALLVVIFFCSLFSALSFSGIHLFSLMKDQDDRTILFTESIRLEPPQEADGYTNIRNLGIEGRFLNDFDQCYFGLPKGVYISRPSSVVPDLCTGDVLLKINGHPVVDQPTLDALLESHAHGASLLLEIYRDGAYQTLSAFFIIPEDEQ